MKFRSPWLIRIVAFAIAAVLRAWLWTVRVRMVVADGSEYPPDPRRARYLYAFWHESLLAPVKVRTPVKVLISRSADGELIARTCAHLGIGAIRGSSSRGGAQGLLGMVRDDAPTHLAITPDGPRGPRRKLQLGTIFVASCTGLPIVPVGVGFTRAWRAGSWDRFALPRPGSTICGVIGAPILIPRELDDDGLDHYRQHVENALLAVTADAERWAAELAAARRPSCVPAPHLASPLVQHPYQGVSRHGS